MKNDAESRISKTDKPRGKESADIFRHVRRQIISLDLSLRNEFVARL